MPNTEFYAILVKLSLRCRCSSMVECQLPKLNTRVRFPSPAPHFLRQKFFENRKKCLQFSLKYANISSVVNTTYPGVAKFGIALDWGSRGRRFKSCHSDQTMIIRTTLSKWVMCSDLSFLLNMCFDGQGRDYHPALVFLDLF